MRRLCSELAGSVIVVAICTAASRLTRLRQPPATVPTPPWTVICSWDNQRCHIRVTCSAGGCRRYQLARNGQL